MSLRFVWFGAFVSVVVAAGFGLFWFVGRGGSGSGDAEATLARLSKQGEGLSYRVRYEGADPTDPMSLSDITFYREPGVGYRFDLPTPLLQRAPGDIPSPHLDDAKIDDDLLKSGDIFIVNLERSARSDQYISCRTTRATCRTADGLEVLAIASFLTLFEFDQPFFEQPHTVTRTNAITGAGESGECFVVTQRTGTADEQATASASGFVPGAGLPETLCYAADGIPLGGLVSDTAPNMNWLKAVELERRVDSAVFDPPFPVVPSIYDRTPTVGPMATPTPQ